MNNVKKYKEKACDFIKKIGDNTAHEQLTLISESHKSDSFRVCLAGGFSKGKTRLLNTLLQTDLFPETAPPTTTLLTEVSYGIEPRFTFHNSQEKKDFSFTHDNLDKFSAGGDFSDAVGTLSVRYPSQMLTPSVVLYDTPGVDDVLQQRANVTFKALEICDAALIAVSAVAPLSLTEQAFIDTYLCGKAIPKIALVLTFTDKVPAEDLRKQVSYVVKKAKEIYPTIEVWCAQDISALVQSSICSVMGAAAMRNRIASWANSADLQKMRETRDLLRIQDVIHPILLQQRKFLQNVQSDFAKKQRELDIAYNALDVESQQWKIIQNNFIEKGYETSRAIQDCSKELSRVLCSRIRQEGVENVIKVLHPRLREASDTLSDTIRQHIENDVDELYEILQRDFGITPDTSFRMKRMLSGDSAKYHTIQNNLGCELLQVASDLPSDLVLDASDGIIDYLPLPPLAKTGLRKLVPHGIEFLKKKISSESGKMKERHLDNRISQYFSQLNVEFSTMVHEIYVQIIAQIQKNQQAWINVQRVQLNSVHDMDNATEYITILSKNIAFGEELIHEIQLTIGE